MFHRSQYEYFIYTLSSQHPSIRMSTLVLVPPNLDTARLTGLLTFGTDVVLCAYEVLDFHQGSIMAYRYEVSQC